MIKYLCFSFSLILLLTTASIAQRSDATMNSFITSLMGKMTLEEKNRPVEFTERG
ncbi:hypothetical protein [Niabella ginsengisoli]|uniref:Beta-glucosidase n=1 Tax=Niabella ginsengisoli TaxID=522298 RepID=A0ABS9SMZ6_9BACT|nr:hypothetical protein [Niabella ginsengisoli]MCH5599651.1 hypothetical protein [Niabella ginsengisoli]